MSRAVARWGMPRVLVGVQRATALCQSARCPRFILPSRRRRRQKEECRGRQPFVGARGVLASSFLLAAAGGKKGVCNSPESMCPCVLKHLTFNLLSIKIEGSLRCFYFNMYLSHDLQFERFMFHGTYIFQDEGECATESGMSQYLVPIHIHLSGCCTLEGGQRSYFGNATG